MSEVDPEVGAFQERGLKKPAQSSTTDYKLKAALIAVFSNMSSGVKVFNFAFQASVLKSFYYQQHPQPSWSSQQISRETLTRQGQQTTAASLTAEH